MISNKEPLGSDENSPYIIPPSKEVESVRSEGTWGFDPVVRYKDGTEWVVLQNRQEERFCGYLYLQQMITEKNMTRIKAAENKMARAEDIRACADKSVYLPVGKIMYLSRYYPVYLPEDNFSSLVPAHPRMDCLSDSIKEEVIKEMKALGEDVKFIDVATNISEKDGYYHVFDTEKLSFDESQHKFIDHFMEEHKRIRSIAESILHLT